MSTTIDRSEIQHFIDIALWSSSYNMRTNILTLSITPSCNIYNCKYLPLREMKLQFWEHPTVRNIYINSKCPNSINRILDCLMYNSAQGCDYYQTGSPTEEKVKYLIGNTSIMKQDGKVNKITPQFLLCLKTERLSEKKGYRIIHYEEDVVTGKKNLSVYSLLIARDFIEHPDSKSLYQRLNKDFIPLLVKNGVEVVITSSEEILKNAYKPDSLYFDSPFKRKEYLDMIVEETRKRVKAEAQPLF